MYEVVEDHTSTDEDFLSVRAGQLVEVLDKSERAWLAITIPQGEGEEEVEGFISPRCLRKAKPPSSASMLTEQFEAETGQEVLQGQAAQEEEVDAHLITEDRPLPSKEAGLNNTICSEESTGQSLSSPLHPLPSPDFDALTPSQNSPTDDVMTTPTGDKDGTKDLPFSMSEGSQPLPPSPPPHADLLAGDSLGELPSSYPDTSSMGSQGSQGSPPLALAPLVSMENPNNNKGLPLSSSLHSLPSSFSPTATPTNNQQKFLGYNPMMVGVASSRPLMVVLCPPLPH